MVGDEMSVHPFNHYANTAYESSWLKLIVKLSFQKEILGEIHLGVGTPNNVKNFLWNISWYHKKFAP